jgi:membrane protease subunit HflK
MLTDDENIVDVQFAVQYTLKSPEDYLFKNRTRTTTCCRPPRPRSARWWARAPWTSCCRRAAARSRANVKKLMQDILDRYETGINVTTVNLQSASAPEPVLPAFEDVVRAQQDRERFKNEGQAYANDVVPKAQGIARASRKRPTATSRA